MHDNSVFELIPFRVERQDRFHLSFKRFARNWSNQEISLSLQGWFTLARGIAQPLDRAQDPDKVENATLVFLAHCIGVALFPSCCSKSHQVPPKKQFEMKIYCFGGNLTIYIMYIVNG